MVRESSLRQECIPVRDYFNSKMLANGLAGWLEFEGVGLLLLLDHSEGSAG